MDQALATQYSDIPVDIIRYCYSVNQDPAASVVINLSNIMHNNYWANI